MEWKGGEGTIIYGASTLWDTVSLALNRLSSIVLSSHLTKAQRG